MFNSSSDMINSSSDMINSSSDMINSSSDMINFLSQIINSLSEIINSFFQPHTGSGSCFYFQKRTSNTYYRLKMQPENLNNRGIFALEPIGQHRVPLDPILFYLGENDVKNQIKYYLLVEECEHIYHYQVSQPIAAENMSTTYESSLVCQIGHEMPNGQAIRTFNYLTPVDDSHSSTIVKSYAALLVPEQDLTLLITKIDETKNKAALPKEPSPSGVVEGISAFDKHTRKSKLNPNASIFEPKNNNSTPDEKKLSPHSR